MNTNWTECLTAILRYEGGFSQHPSDPGGATKWGITHKVLAEWRGVASVSAIQVNAMDRPEMEAIYRARYWDACRCGELPDGIDLMAFDCAVNQGVGRASRFLQQAAGVAVDGVIGPRTLAAVRSKVAGPLLMEYAAIRMNAYGNLTKLFKVFGMGWSRRLMDVHGRSLALAIAAEVERPKTSTGRPQPLAPHLEGVGSPPELPEV